MGTMKPVRLPDVTLCCVDTRHPQQAQDAMRRCLHDIDFARALFFCSAEWAAAQSPDDPIHHLPIAPLRCIEDYNRFMLLQLREHVTTSHVLVVQWDGFVSNPDLWDPSFLSWDYIGAPWYHGDSPGSVGNGGFSLRSAKLLDALASLAPTDQEPEDMAICVTLRPQLEQCFGIRIAPLDVAQRFACEYGPYRRSFGFHGLHNFAYVMRPEELRAWLESAPHDILRSVPARKLVKSLMRGDRATEALELLERRAQVSKPNLDHLNLVLRAHLHRLIEKPR